MIDDQNDATPADDGMEDFEDNPFLEAGITDDPDIVDPDELPEGDPDEEFDFVDGIDVPDLDNDLEEAEVSLDDFPDEEGVI